MMKEAWDALKAAMQLDTELRRQREDILRALNIIRALAAENTELRSRLARLEQTRANADAQMRAQLLASLRSQRQQ